MPAASCANFSLLITAIFSRIAATRVSCPKKSPIATWVSSLGSSIYVVCGRWLVNSSPYAGIIRVLLVLAGYSFCPVELYGIESCWCGAHRDNRITISVANDIFCLWGRYGLEKARQEVKAILYKWFWVPYRFL